jgi:hypothetical protein
MGAITALSDAAFRNYVTDGVPASGPQDPVKAEIRAIFAAIESALGIQTVVLASSYGVKSDGVELTAACTISNGSNALYVAGAAFTDRDVGKTIIVPAIGAAGAFLTTTILGVTDGQHVLLGANASAALAASTRIIRYGTDDTLAIRAAITAARNLPATLWFTEGISLHSGMIEWGWNNLCVRFLGDKFQFIYSGAGTTAHSWNGIANYGGTSQGCTGVSFGSPGCQPILRGHPGATTTYAALLDNCHFGAIHIRPRDATHCLWMQNNGVVGASSVCMVIESRSSFNVDGAFNRIPNTGLFATQAVACIFPNLIVEGCGSNGSFAVVISLCQNNLFYGGTVESNATGGINDDAGSSRNTAINVDVEVNGAAEDWKLLGENWRLINCAGGGTTAGSKFNGTWTRLDGGDYQSVIINDNNLSSEQTRFRVAATNNGVSTQIISPIGGLLAPTEAAASVLANKIYNTANGNTFSVNNKSVTDLSGTGSVLVTTVNPAFTGSVKTTGSGGVGYATGAGGPVTQATSKVTGVTLNKICGQITMNNAALGSSAVASFTLTNSAIDATDIVSANISSGATAGAYRLIVDAVAAGSCRISLVNGSGGSLSEAVVINFAVIKGVNS